MGASLAAWHTSWTRTLLGCSVTTVFSGRGQAHLWFRRLWTSAILRSSRSMLFPHGGLHTRVTDWFMGAVFLGSCQVPTYHCLGLGSRIFWRPDLRAFLPGRPHLTLLGTVLSPLPGQGCISGVPTRGGTATRCVTLEMRTAPRLAPLPRAWVLSLGCPSKLSWWTGVSTWPAHACGSPIASGPGGRCHLTACAPRLHGLACRRPLRGSSSSAASADNWLSLVAQTARSSLLPRPLGRFKNTHQCVSRTCSGLPAASRVQDAVGDEASLPRRVLSQARAFTVHTSSLGVLVLLCSVWPCRKGALWS